MFRARQQKLAALNTVLQENVAGVRVVRAFAREDFEIERYRRANADLLEQGLAGAPHGRQRLPAHVQHRHDRRRLRDVGRRGADRPRHAHRRRARRVLLATSSCCSAR